MLVGLETFLSSGIITEEDVRELRKLRKDILTKENILKEFTSFINGIPASSFEKENNRAEKFLLDCVL